MLMHRLTHAHVVVDRPGVGTVVACRRRLTVSAKQVTVLPLAFQGTQVSWTLSQPRSHDLTPLFNSETTAELIEQFKLLKAAEPDIDREMLCPATRLMS